MADRLELEARFKDLASGGVKKLAKNLEGVKPSNGMQAAQKWMADFRKEADGAFKVVRPLQSGLNALGVSGLAVGFSLGEIVKQMRELGDSTLNMKELGRQSGMTMDQIRRLQYAAGKLHVDPAAVGGAISSWSGKMVEFRMHVSDFYRYLMRQNADVAAKIAADSPVDALKDTLDYLSRIKDPQIQKRVADMAGVGDLVPMLGKGPQGLAEAFSDAAREVKPISQALIDASERLNESTNRLSNSWTNLKNDVGPSFLDPMSHMIDRLDEVLKGANANPGDAAALAGVGVFSAAALFARRRIMRGSKIMGGTGLDRAAGELTGAAGALKEAAAALGGGKGGPGGSGGSSGSGLGGSSPGYANLLSGAALAGLQLFDLARNAPDELRKLQENPDKDAASPEMEFAAKLGDTVRGWFKGSASDKWSAPSRYDAEARARGGDLKKDVQEGAKRGIVEGLRELAQQQELDGGGGPAGNSFGVKSSSGGLGGTGRHFGGGHPFAGASLGDHARGGIGRNAAGMAAGARESFDFWRSKGLTREQAAGLVGMEQGESQFNPRIVGDSGLAHGAFQHHPDRRARIFAATGINIDTATHRQQLEAAYWEFQHTHKAAWDAVRQGKSATDAARSGVYLFEAPLDKRGQSTIRGGMAEGWLKRFNDEDAKKGNPPGAGTPAPSAAAVSDSEAFKARAKALNGTPPGHRAGGWIRGPGTGTSDSVPALLSNGEFVVRAKAAGAFLPLLHAINSGQLGGFAGGGPVGFGVARQFYPTGSAGISDAEGAGNRRFWRDFMRRPRGAGGMGASWRTTLATLAMMQGESGRGLNAKSYGWDVNGPSGGVDQLHDVTTGRGAGRLRRLSDLMTLGMQQHADWRDPWIQAANFKREALGSMNFAWRKMVAARSAGAALKEGIDKFENPADHARELLRRMPNLVRLQREALADGAATRQELGPLDVTIRHHHDGRTSVQAKAGKGVRLGIRTGPTMRPT